MSSEELKTFTPLPSNLQRYHDDDPLLNPKPQPTTQTRIMVPTQSTIQDLDKTYAPYVRHDLYGTMGRAHLSLNDKFLLGIGLFFLFPVRVFLGTFILFIYYLICRFCTAFREPNGEEGEQEDYAHVGGWRRTVMLQGGRYLSRLVLFVFGFYWIRKTVRRTHHDQQGGDDGVSCNETTCIYQPEDVKRPGAIVSNHVSYVDILYHMSTSFPSFVAKRSVGKLPLVGLISKCLGCVYVQRESKSADFKGVSAVVNERIRDAHQNKSAPNIMLFPEGTTTNGGYLLPFKTGAFLAKAPLRPVLLRYPYQRFSPAWDSISGFVNHIEVTQLPVYHPSEQEKEQPKLYAENVRRMMAREGNLILSDLGLPEKRVYHAALNGKIIMPTALHQKAE